RSTVTLSGSCNEIRGDGIRGIDLPGSSECASGVRGSACGLISKAAEHLRVCPLRLGPGCPLEPPPPLGGAAALQKHGTQGHAESGRNGWLGTLQLFSHGTFVRAQASVPTT